MSISAYLPTCLLGLGLATLAGHAASQSEPVQVIKPEEQTSYIKPAEIDTEHFELGVFSSALSVEDFSTNLAVGLSFAYHINDRFFAQLHYGQATIDRATFEDVAGGDFLADEDRDFTYQSLTGGYTLMHGRSFFGAGPKFNSRIYVMGGPAKVSFAGQDSNGVMFGIGYKTVMTDWLAIDVGFRDIVADREFLGTSKTTHNTELSIGLNAFF